MRHRPLNLTPVRLGLRYRQLNSHRQSGKILMSKGDFAGAADEFDKALEMHTQLKEQDQKDALVELLADIYRQREIDCGRATPDGQKLRFKVAPDQRVEKIEELRMQMEERLRCIGRADLQHQYVHAVIHQCKPTSRVEAVGLVAYGC